MNKLSRLCFKGFSEIGLDTSELDKVGELEICLEDKTTQKLLQQGMARTYLDIRFTLFNAGGGVSRNSVLSKGFTLKREITPSEVYDLIENHLAKTDLYARIKSLPQSFCSSRDYTLIDDEIIRSGKIYRRKPKS